MTERSTVTITVCQGNIFGSIVDSNKYEADTVREVISWLTDRLEEVPPEYKDTAKFEVQSVGGYESEHHSEYTISYDRPETDEEMVSRIAIMRARAEEELRRHQRYADQAAATLRNLAR